MATGEAQRVNIPWKSVVLPDFLHTGILCVKQCGHGNRLYRGKSGECGAIEKACAKTHGDGHCSYGTDPGGCDLENISYLHSCESKRERV